MPFGIIAGLSALLFGAPPPNAGPPAVDNLDLPWLIGADDGKALRPAPPASARLRVLGASLYRARCAGCHGEAGDGRGPLAARLRPVPTDFRRGVYKLRSTPAGSLPTDTDLFRTLTRGMHGTAMLPWRRLEEQERWALVYHLKGLSPRFREARPEAPIEVPLAPRETETIKDHGETLYVRLRCGSCHGDSGAGDGPAREKLRLAGNREVRARDFTRGRFIRGAEMEDIYLTLKVGIEGTPMAAYPALGDDELWALAAYVRLLIHERPLQELPPARSVAGGLESGVR